MVINDVGVGARDVVAAFLEVCGAHPGRPALIDNERELSYATVLGLASELASRLGPDCGVVGVMASRSANTIIALLGVLLAGGTYCPIDPSFPLARQETIARLSGCRVLVTTGTPAEVAPELRSVDLSALSHEAGRGARAWHAVPPDAPAYILFTSGSTGDPKPVVTPRRAISAAVHSLRELFEIEPADRVLQFASLNWDTCFEEILPALTAGAALVIHDDAYSGSLPRLVRLVDRAGITVMDLPTAVWHELVYYMADGPAELPERLRLVVIGGEAARPARLADWSRRDTGQIRLVNTYGCTETTLVTHAVDLHGPGAGVREPAWGEATEVPIGRALPHVVERISETGELLIGGPALASGYLGARHATDSRFRTLDLGRGPERYFATGDRVLRSATGELVHRGRVDGQIKVRGIRVDPGEVEAAITSYGGVAGAAVVGVTAGDHTALHAYVVPRPGANGDTLATEILSHLRSRVPAHLIPSRLIVVPELIHTPSGKVDRAASHMRHAPRARGRGSVNEY